MSDDSARSNLTPSSHIEASDAADTSPFPDEDDAFWQERSTPENNEGNDEPWHPVDVFTASYTSATAEHTAQHPQQQYESNLHSGANIPPSPPSNPAPRLPSTTAYNIPSMAAKLHPIQPSLERLKTTPAPPYHPHLSVKTRASVLRERLLPIGRHVLALLGEEPEEGRGVLEMGLW